MQTINATEARKMFPFVVGPIERADLHSGFAVLHMGLGAYGVVVAGEFVGCCPDYAHAKRAGEDRAFGGELVFADINEDNMRAEVRKDVMHGDGYSVRLIDLDSGNTLPTVFRYPYGKAGKTRAINKAKRLLHTGAKGTTVRIV